MLYVIAHALVQSGSVWRLGFVCRVVARNVANSQLFVGFCMRQTLCFNCAFADAFVDNNALSFSVLIINLS